MQCPIKFGLNTICALIFLFLLLKSNVLKKITMDQTECQESKSDNLKKIALKFVNITDATCI